MRHRSGLGERWRIGGFALAVCALGILLWARLILVTGHPRSAIATPEPSSDRAGVTPPRDERPVPDGRGTPVEESDLPPARSARR
ncbi:MAG: hypothetical protein KIT68_09275 [Phycisphaeraceae bacterium]|nr:hypothetical protein [Phycisphaeraceae bacterium]